LEAFISVIPVSLQQGGANDPKAYRGGAGAGQATAAHLSRGAAGPLLALPAGGPTPGEDCTMARTPETVTVPYTAAGGDGEQARRSRQAARAWAAFRWGLFASLGALTVYLGLRALVAAQGVLIRALIALFFAVSLDPAVRWLTRQGLRRGLAVAIIFGLTLLLVVGFMVSIIPGLVAQSQTLAADLPRYLDELNQRSSSFRVLNRRFDVSSQVQGLLGSLPSRLGSGLLGFTGRVFGALFGGLTILVLTIYFMADLPRLRSGLVRLMPRTQRARSAEVVDLVFNKVGDYMIGNILISIVAGTAAYAAFLLLDVQFAIPLAILVAVFDLIPMVGATLGAILCVAVAAITTDIWPTTVLVALFFVAYQQLENYVIAPRILRTTVDISAPAVLLAGLIGATVLGLVGALMAIPVAAAVKVLYAQRMAVEEAAAGPPILGPPPGRPTVEGSPGGPTVEGPPGRGSA
jgi:predicted PurR-regulated permease PerM